LEHAPPAVPASNSCAEGFPCNFRLFEDCFVKFELFDVIFIYFLNIIICIVDVKRKREKEKNNKKKIKRKRNKRETKMHVCIYFRDLFMMRRQKNKEGFNILIGSRCRSTNLYGSCISKI